MEHSCCVSLCRTIPVLLAFVRFFEQVTWARARCRWEEAASQVGPETFQNVEND
jgi:hypothetical protein